MMRACSGRWPTLPVARSSPTFAAASCPPGEIAARFPISGPSISRHLSILRAAGLVTERRDANRILYSLVPEQLAVCVGNFLSAVCPEQVILRHRRTRAAARKPKEPPD